MHREVAALVIAAADFDVVAHDALVTDVKTAVDFVAVAAVVDETMRS